MAFDGKHYACHFIGAQKLKHPHRIGGGPGQAAAGDLVQPVLVGDKGAPMHPTPDDDIAVSFQFPQRFAQGYAADTEFIR